MSEKYFLHVDMDAFFASVEQLDHPQWKGKPVIVGGLPGERRSVVSTASYEARKFGVHSAMPTFQAYKLCPQGIYTHGNYRRYSEISSSIMELLKQYTPDVTQLSIDEASMDISGTQMLFGEPQELALEIKNEILEKTGLTVSVGLASSAYLAKLCSEVNKPNGFFWIKPGDEEKFMLNLPLAKIWGIGKKTLEKIKNAGFRTSKELHEKPLNYLKTVFGEGTGVFLYNTLRGIPPEAPKQTSHSISAENTFEYDLCDVYSGETAILELCHTIMFRLLKEKSYSRTVMLKLRYDDFSTFTVQSTESEYITSVDDLYRRTCALFEKKYENGRGIRLLGVGVENVEKEMSAKQEVLFDFGEKKRQAVENAIFDLTSKHPEIKIKKARLLSGEKSEKLKTLIFLAFLPLFLNVPKVFAQTKPTIITEDAAASITLPQQTLIPLPKEAPISLFNFSKNSKQIDFSAGGWWQGAFLGGANLSFLQGNTTLSPITPVFKQKVDLTMNFMLNRQWYFKTSFADEFNKNTISAGFLGKETNSINEIKISNRNITFPQTYSLNLLGKSLSGGENQAPGIAASFKDKKNNKWNADILVRYDMVKQNEATFYGMNSVSQTQIELSQYVSGQIFFIPNKELLADIKSIFVEENDGTRKELSSDNFQIITAENTLILSKDCFAYKKNGKLPKVIVEFNSDWPNLETEFGSYSEESTFLGKIQALFNFSQKINLKNFSYNFVEISSSKKRLVIQSPQGFSPFVNASYYDCAIQDSAEVSIEQLNSNSSSENYSVSFSNDITEMNSSNSFYENHAYAQIYCKNQINEVQKLFPLAQTMPQVYLSVPYEKELVLVVNSYTPVNSFEIGTDASEGSIHVYKNGILDSNAKYNSEMGTISLSSSVSDLDKIYVTWNEETNSLENGSLSTQAAFNYNFTQNFNGDIALSSSWPLSQSKKYAEYENPSYGFATLSTGLNYSKNNIKIENATSLSIENNNTTGFYRIEGFENCRSQTVYNFQNAAFLLSPKTEPTLNSTLPKIELKAQNNCTIETSALGIKDSSITGYAFPLEWNFPQNSEEKSWAALNFSLQDGDLLLNANKFNLALKIEEITTAENWKAFLQLGVQADSSTDFEYSDSIPTWEISSDSSGILRKLDLSKKGVWQTVEIALTEEQISKINKYKDARIVILSAETNLDEKKLSGIVKIGPHEIITNGIFTYTESNCTITTLQKIDNSIPQNQRFNNTNNYVQQINWNFLEVQSLSDLEKAKILAAKNIPQTDISSYKKLKTYFKFENLSFSKSFDFPYSSEDFPLFKFVLDADSEGITTDGKNAIEFTLSSEKLIPFMNDFWHTIEINLEEKKVFIDSTEFSVQETNLKINKSVLATRIKIELPLIEEKKSISSGSFLIDEIHLEESSAYFLLQDVAVISYEKKGSILKIKDFNLLEDANFYSKNTLLSTFYINSDENKNNQSIFATQASLAFTLAKIKFETEANFSTEQKSSLLSASQSISSPKPIFNIFSFNDSFVFDAQENSSKKRTFAQIDLKNNDFPISFLVNANTLLEQTKRWEKQTALTKTVFAYRGKAANVEVSANATFNQKTDFLANTQTENTTLYFERYLKNSEQSFSIGNENATSRNVQANFNILTDFPSIFFKPELIFTSSEKYSNNSSSKRNENFTLQTNFPFNIKKHQFSFDLKRESNFSRYVQQGGNYVADLNELFTNPQQIALFFRPIPFAELFTNEVSNIFLEKTNNSDFLTAFYSTSYGFKWKRKLFANIKDFFIPSGTDFVVTRNIQSASNLNDNYIYKLSILSTPFNVFSSQGTFKLFKKFTSDEYIFSVTAKAKVPSSTPKDSVYTISSYAQGTLFKTAQDYLKSGVEFEVSTEKNWKIGTTFLWNRKTNFSPIKSAIQHFVNKEKFKQINMFRTNSFNLNITKLEQKITQNYKIDHTINFEILKYITLSTGLSAAFTEKTDSASILELTANIGGKVLFQ